MLRLYEDWRGCAPQSVEQLPGAGSNRTYYRFWDAEEDSLIGVVGTSREENEAFIYLAGHFGQKRLPVVRLGNLFNSEIFGMATTLPWGFEFVRSAKWVNEFAPAAVHPTQIYEALCYLATFGLLCWLYYAKDMARRRPGILFGIGLIGIFLTRFFIEFIKTEQEAFEQGWLLDMGQWLSIPFILLGIYMIYRGATQPEVVPVVPKSPAATAKKKKK